MNRNLYRGIVFFLLLGVWMVLSGLFDAFHLTLGVISCAIVTWLSSDLLFQNRNTGLRARLRQSIRLCVYLVWLLKEIILANLHLLKLSFGPKTLLQPQIVRYRTSLQSDFEKFLLANSITLTPGTVTMRIHGDTFYIHAISDIASSGLDGTMERKIAHVFASAPLATGDQSNPENA